LGGVERRNSSLEWGEILVNPVITEQT
jgi:hypothetical protein